MFRFIFIFIFIFIFHSIAIANTLNSISMDVDFTKKSKNFQIKNIFPFFLPENSSENINIVSINGYALTTTLPLGKSNFVSSETLFGLTYTNAPTGCPYKGEAISSYAEMGNRFPGIPLAAVILKQTRPGTNKFSFNYKFPKGIPINVLPNGCFFISLDGSDFSNKDYRMKANFNVIYKKNIKINEDDIKKIFINNIDAEFLVAPSTGRGPALNAYVVLPVSTSGVIKPGVLLGVYGNVAATAASEFHQEPSYSADWNIREIVAVYHHNSCLKAFPGHGSGKFTWNDPTSSKNLMNPTSALWKTSELLGNIEILGNGHESITKSIQYKKSIILSQGDCIVAASLPNSINPYVSGALNIEVQLKVISEPRGF
ncbi:hypothetical protein [Acetobacter thailandicus]|uniref:hypothetical protein n=1 Tax=Acetobacter thailandicus TaxID=1502842 RepID=UPI001BAA0CA2|nr:hypothetical protein [Acetobacter thailandicus]MBS0987026.1 hypothetical protein [Acetobacter thailandicus]